MVYSSFMLFPAFIFILNLPWTLLELALAIISVPLRLKFSSKPIALIFQVKSFWWQTWLPGYKKVRAAVQGHVIMLGPTADGKDLAHEFLHVEQYQRTPFIQPFLYTYQTLRYGHRQNKYEAEAYKKSQSRYDES